MSMREISRRRFVAGSPGAAGAAHRGVAFAAESSRAPAGESRAIRLGGPVFVRTEDPDELASAHVKLGYRVYLERLSKLPPAPPLMIEHLPNAEEYDRARQCIFEVGKADGIGFG